MSKLTAVLILLSHLVTPNAFSSEKGYQEALEYFIQRDKDKKKNSVNESSVDSDANFILNPNKVLIGLGLGELSDIRYFSAELGVSLIQSRYFQQTLYIEYLHFDTKSLKEYRTGSISNSYGEGLLINHSAQLSSKLFFLSPEVSLGVGRVFSAPLKGGLISLRGGLVYSNKWSQRFLFSAHLYYRRSEYFKSNLGGEGFGLVLKFGF